MAFSNGDRYPGMASTQNTWEGTYQYKTGEIYEGRFLQGKQTGKGLYRYPNGATLQVVGHRLPGRRRNLYTPFRRKKKWQKYQKTNSWLKKY
ncbi:MAG: hypothetical protein IPN79_06270 [Saprospiraceae bacterium]|nr:hypothetical protein [Saprospiraceae bacterium]